MAIVLVICLVVIALSIWTARSSGTKKVFKHADDLAIGIAKTLPGARIEHRDGVTYVIAANVDSKTQSAPDSHLDSHLPLINWVKEFTPPEPCRIEYQDRHGVSSDRKVYMAKRGIATNGHEYIGVFDAGVFKTFRADRITEIEML